MGLLGACTTTLASFSFIENNVYADLLLDNQIGLSLPPLVNLVANMVWMSCAIVFAFICLYYLCEMFSASMSKSRIWSTD